MEHLSYILGATLVAAPVILFYVIAKKRKDKK